MFKILCIGLVILLQQAQAKDTSSLTLGLGLSYVSMPEYIGSSVQKNYVFPYPYIQYESENISVKDNVLFGHLYHADDFAIDLSFSGSLSGKSESDSLRYKMEQLDPTVEIGLNFIYKLFYLNDVGYVSFELPMRTVYSVSFSKVGHQGYTTNPNIALKYALSTTTKIKMSMGATFATKEFHNYFYQVKAKDVTATRAEYESKGGYSGFTTSLGISHGTKTMRYGAFLKYYNLNGTEFRDSPLVDTDNALFYGLGASYIF